jgi:tRNA1(Val) A37 N6-methylase TrmN6
LKSKNHHHRKLYLLTCNSPKKKQPRETNENFNNNKIAKNIIKLEFRAVVAAAAGKMKKNEQNTN